jgi:hypothetical protein
MSNSRQYSIHRQVNSKSRNFQDSGASVAILQILSFGARTVLCEAESIQPWAFDEIRFTRSIPEKEKLHETVGFLEESAFGHSQIKQVHIISLPQPVSLLPRESFSEASALSLMERLCPETSDLEIDHSEVLPGIELLFGIPKNWKSWSDGLFHRSEVRWHSGTAHLISYLSEQNQGNGLTAWVLTFPDQVQILVFDDVQPRFVNSFDIQTENDLLYYVLLVLNSVGMDPQTARVWLGGELLAGSAGFEKLQRYLGNADFFRPFRPGFTMDGFEFLYEPPYLDLLSFWVQNFGDNSNKK